MTRPIPIRYALDIGLTRLTLNHSARQGAMVPSKGNQGSERLLLPGILNLCSQFQKLRRLDHKTLSPHYQRSGLSPLCRADGGTLRFELLQRSPSGLFNRITKTIKNGFALKRTDAAVCTNVRLI